MYIYMCVYSNIYIYTYYLFIYIYICILFTYIYICIIIYTYQTTFKQMLFEKEYWFDFCWFVWFEV